ncbi:MAG: shikimate kinase [Lachnospiraceae bacterium]|nr:shikimate kinase [Lachnospiraceae bacterium]
MKDNIILTGFMGCGKTSVGIRLSYTLRRTLIDTDKWIEKKQGKTVSEIFASEGEEAFRRMESECIRELIGTAEGQIISTGGGLPVRKENRKLLKKLGTVYYLEVTPECVFERLKGDTTRPLLQGENPREKIRELLEAREAFYQEGADVVIEVSAKSFEDIITEIVEGMEERA